MITIDAFRRLGSCVAWLVLISMVLPSVVANAILYAACGAAAPPDLMDAWRSISKEAFPTSPVAHLILQIGRGGFKSTMLFILAIDRLLRFDPRPFIAPGSEVTAVIVAPKMKQAAAIVRSNRALAEAVAALLGGKLVVRDMTDGAEMIFDIPNLGYVARIVVGPADQATIRGIAPVFFGVSEAGWMPSAAKAANTLAVVRVGVVPRGRAQFPHFLECEESTNGPPAGYFFEVCQNPPAGALKIGPLSSGTVNSTIDDAKLRETLSPEEYSQEILCTTWGLKEAAWIPTAPAMAIVDEDGEWTAGTIPQTTGARVAFDHGGKDEIATLLGRRVEVEIAPGHFVAHLVFDFGDYWRPERTPPTSEQVKLPLNVSRAAGGVPIICDGRAIADVQSEASQAGFKSPEIGDDDERRKYLGRGGKIVVQMPMDPRHQTERFTRLRELVMAGRVHVANTDAGRELARQLTMLRATTLASRYLRIEAESGAEDGLADCASYLAEAFDSMPGMRRDGVRNVRRYGNVHFDFETRSVVPDDEWIIVDKDGHEIGKGAPPPDDPSMPSYFIGKWSIGEQDGACRAFLRMRLGKEHASRPEVEALLEELATEGSIQREHPVLVALEQERDPLLAMMRQPGRTRI